MKSRQLISRFIKVRNGFSAISFMTTRLISVSSDRFYPMGYLKSGSKTNKRHYGFTVWKDISLTGNIPTDHVRTATAKAKAISSYYTHCSELVYGLCVN